MDTLWMLLARYEGQPVVPVDVVASEYFGLKPIAFLRKVAEGDIDLPLIRMEESQKSMKGVHVTDLAAYIDARRAEAQKERDLLHA